MALQGFNLVGMSASTSGHFARPLDSTGANASSLGGTADPKHHAPIATTPTPADGVVVFPGHPHRSAGWDVVFLTAHVIKAALLRGDKGRKGENQ
jgi:hypothetical protein